MKEVKKSALKPGMEVRNKITGSVGVVRGKNGKILDCADWCVRIRRKVVAGKNKGRYDYAFWNVENLEIIQ